MIGEWSEVETSITRMKAALRHEGPFGDEKEKAEAFYSAVRLRDRFTLALAHHEQWEEDIDYLFTPYDTDETGIHGRSDMPSPYAAEWRNYLLSEATKRID